MLTRKSLPLSVGPAHPNLPSKTQFTTCLLDDYQERGMVVGDEKETIITEAITKDKKKSDAPALPALLKTLAYGQ
jgi:hypothetical protein